MCLKQRIASYIPYTSVGVGTFSSMLVHEEHLFPVFGLVW